MVVMPSDVANGLDACGILGTRSMARAAGLPNLIGPRLRTEIKLLSQKQSRRPCPRVAKEGSADPGAQMCAGGDPNFKALFGVGTPEIAAILVGQAKALQRCWVERASVDDALGSAIHLIAELQPRTIVEGMLAVQMVGVHAAATCFLARATLEGQTFEGADANVLRATRLMRLFTDQLEAMAKLNASGREPRDAQAG
jgi:hypothetical protein